MCGVGSLFYKVDVCIVSDRDMRRIGTVLVGWMIWSATAFAAWSASLDRQIEDYIAHPRFNGASWGLKVVSLKTGMTLAAHASDRLLNPASNAKLFSGALVLDHFGSKHRFATEFLATTPVSSDGTLDGDLIVKGGGDMTLAARFHNGDYRAAARRLVAPLVEAGLKEVKGRLIADDSLYTRSGPGIGWDWDDLQYYYGAPASPLTIEDNVVDLVIRPGRSLADRCFIELKPELGALSFINETRTLARNAEGDIRVERALGESQVVIRGGVPLGSKNVGDAVSVPDPSAHFLAILGAELKRQGIHVRGREAVKEPGEHPVSLAKVEGEELSVALDVMMKRSNNLYSQMMFLNVGAASELERKEGDSTTDLARKELEVFLEKAGVNGKGVYLQEGAGLSRGDLLSAEAVCQLLTYMKTHPEADAFISSLPVGGESGTLKVRMKETSAAANVRAKTGTLRFVYTLSGYATTAAGEPVVFSILLNHYRAPTRWEARQSVDRIAAMICDWK